MKPRFVHLGFDLEKKNIESETRKARSIKRCLSLRRKPIGVRRRSDGDGDRKAAKNRLLEREREHLSLNSEKNKKEKKSEKRIERGYL